MFSVFSGRRDKMIHKQRSREIFVNTNMIEDGIELAHYLENPVSNNEAFDIPDYKCRCIEQPSKHPVQTKQFNLIFEAC